MDERERVLLSLAGVRVFMGLFWLVNLLWRLPTDFGTGNYWGLPRTFEVARRHGSHRCCASSSATSSPRTSRSSAGRSSSSDC